MPHPPNAPRQDVSPQNCWDLTPMFASVDDWEFLYKDLESRIPEYEKFAKHFAKSFEQFKACLDFDHAVTPARGWRVSYGVPEKR